MVQVLVVNQEDDFARSLKAAFEAEGIGVLLAPSEREAWEAMSPRPPDVVVVGDGPLAIELAERVRQSYPTLPLILLTERSTARRAPDQPPPPLSVVRVLERPVAPQTVAAEVEAVLHQGHPRGRR